ncbi:MAG: hypothetical protein F4Y01_05590 [Gammaproteobacteria bacterium]|nr:hypothetical protein [Gammaproteobacteria bacterium]
MSPDVIAILGVGITLAGLILGTVVPGFRELRREVASLHDRMNRFEAEIRDLTEGFMREQRDQTEGTPQL